MLKKSLNKVAKSWINIFLSKIGFIIIKKETFLNGGKISLHQYLDKKGEFDYSRYVRVQKQGNAKKIHAVWVIKENIEYLSKYIIEKIGRPKTGICHGTRQGKEQAWFSDFLKCQVIGTEISDTAKNYKNTIQWDFHDVKEEWIDHFDFIYSNSFDHSYDPEKCLNTWISCVKPGGIVIIEHSDLHGPRASDELDPFGVDISIVPFLIATWGKGKYYVIEILSAPAKPSICNFISFVVIKRDSGALV
jgi:SAM-dependent methyltransferase